jgi:hypothetical protein
MLEGLDRVNWGRLTAAYGPASNTPDHIRWLASSRPKESKEARQALYATIFHQGTRYPATVPAVPFLFELLDEPVTPEKGEIVRLLDSVARPDAVGKSQGAHPGEGAAVSLPIVSWSFGDSPDRPSGDSR